jgi:phosphatidylglycerophosphate synthase
MAATAPQLDAPPAPAPRPTIAEALASIKAPSGWKRRLEDPANTFIRYPIALALTRLFVRTPITPNQISLTQPLLAAVAGWQVTFGTFEHDLIAVLAFELRSILDCCDGSLARAKKMSSPSGHAIDALADWLGVVFLYVGIFIRFNLHPPTAAIGSDSGSLLSWLGVNGVLCLAIFSGAARSFTSDYFRVKFTSVFERRQDDTLDTLRTKILALGPHSTFFDKAEVFIGRMGHLTFNYEYLTREKAENLRSGELVDALRREENAPATRALAFVWGLSNGDAFLTYVMIALLFDKLWLLQELYATVGIVTIVGLCMVSSTFVKNVVRRHASVAVA